MFEVGQEIFVGNDCEETIEAAKAYIAERNIDRHKVKITRRTDEYGTRVAVVVTLPF